MGFRCSVLLVVLAAACTTPNPAFFGDGTFSLLDTGATIPDAGPADAAQPGDWDRDGDGDAASAPDASGCVPGAFIACTAPDALARCALQGTGIEQVSCGAYLCNAEHGRCNLCDPGAPPVCFGDDVTYCTVDGLLATTPCPVGCINGGCADCAKRQYRRDLDGDGFGDFAGMPMLACEAPQGYVDNHLDCNDADPRVFPGQEQYFTGPTAGLGDYNYDCNGVTNAAYLTVAQICRNQPKVGCTGSGWLGPVPACGVEGAYARCVKVDGTKGCQFTAARLTQACR